jgi:hypothetical protein
VVNAVVYDKLLRDGSVENRPARAASVVGKQLENGLKKSIWSLG